MKTLKLILTFILALILLCSCGTAAKVDEKSGSDVATAADGSPEYDVYIDASPSDATGAKEAVGDGGYDPDPSGSTGAAVPDAKPGTLTAGEWKDNDNFDFWKEILSRDDWKEYASIWKMKLDKRFAVTVTNGQNPVKNARVLLYDDANALISTAYTDSYGKAYLYYDIAGEGKVPAKYHVTNDFIADDVAEFTAITAEQLEAGGLSVDVSGWGTFDGFAKYTKLDLMFTTDTTGSMGDELEYLKKELANVISRIADENEGLDIRVSVNFYRDEGDEYVVRDFAFTGDVDEVQRQIDVQFSDGGGDYPEAVHTALDNSITAHDWRGDAIKLMFLTLDAPGHSEIEGVPESIRASVVEAASRGIRIIPVASSGVDTGTEFMLRAMACATGGTYTFLTDDSGVGGPHLEPTIGDYNVKLLNDLLVKIINEYCK